MLNWLKRFWFDLGNLPKPEWGCKYMLLPSALFFTWGLVGHIYISVVTVNQLTPCIGEVTLIETRFERGGKSSKYYPLKIALSGYPHEFRLMDKFKKDFDHIQSEIKKGDTITLYKRNKSQALLSWGTLYDIYQIEKDGRIILPISAIRTDAKNLLPWLSVFSAILWLIYILYRKRIIIKNREYD